MKWSALVLLALAVAVGASWQLETVEELSSPYSGYCSLVLDASGYPRIAYKGDDDDIRYAAWDGAAWQLETVEDITSEYSGYCSLVLDSNDYPRIAYKGNSDEIRYAWWNDPPSAFSLLSPADGATVDDYPLCDWDDSTDPEGGDITYDLWYSTEDDFSTYEELSGLTDSEHQFSDAELAPDTTYYWKVMATDGYDDTWSTETWSFTTTNIGLYGVEPSATPEDDGVLLGWTVSGDVPAGVRVLRGVDDPVAVSGSLPGETTRWLDRGVEPGGSYVYWLEATDSDGRTERYGPTEAVVVPETRRTLTLEAPWPSPASDSVTLAFELPSDAGAAGITIYDLAGRIVESFSIASEAGRQTISLDTAAYRSGVYLATLATNTASETRRFVISR